MRIKCIEAITDIYDDMVAASVEEIYVDRDFTRVWNVFWNPFRTSVTVPEVML